MNPILVLALKSIASPISRRSLIYPLSHFAGKGRSRILASYLVAAVFAVIGNPDGAAAQPAPQISVVFVEPEKFTDVGYAEGERGARAILLQLQKFIVDTAVRHLAESMRLEIKITDIDLAGDFELFRGPQADQVRITKGLYPPRIALEFRLADAAERSLKEGKRTLTDLDYQLRVASTRNDYLRYEKELLRDWLRAEFGALKSVNPN